MNIWFNIMPKNLSSHKTISVGVCVNTVLDNPV